MVTPDRKTFFSNECGYIVVETVGTFIPFILLVVSILSLVNIVALQARVHYALTQAANTLSMYSYALEVMGVANDLTTLEGKAYRDRKGSSGLHEEINGVLAGINAFSDARGAVENGGEAADRVYGLGEEALADPAVMLQLLMNYGLSELRNQLFEELARPLVGRYLGNGAMTGDEYLRSAGVVNTGGGKGGGGGAYAEGLAALQFHEWSGLGSGASVMIDKDGNVILTVHYEIEYTFGGLKLPFSPTLKITQTAVTKAWLNGSGRGYW